ncbi:MULTISPECIES: hypothetical protein [unclassified Siphonobacter]|uniref:hypothetical protein n=1 Tax=unclassified Siphonobacter TaxID=2635712 RepID=UPI000CC88AA5|nr:MULTISPECIES: hypothetical protein [unclassified Siphonobacter]MDQ1087059.1 hypothetical protein [Siphonobacter sp. SORGH_AS_1065]MDR6193171.1 hypothetical protein [Siphonobacter sp. SORGH_AS_0500]PKK36646.1 hypothetical protein BWI96_09660 [Siphonobacter sp. SORGH_AS_0500]
MIQTFTQNDILRYAYEETTTEENQQIEELLMHDHELLLFYLDVMDLKAGLNKIELEPSTRVIDTILNYSKEKRQQSQSRQQYH